ncbi:MAG: glutamine amidotransferase [Verrucomicrobiota bacterium]|nr:glutamine amidotransferase [Verrucomicrobiota bacterium]
MNFQFTNPLWLWLLIPALGIVGWLAWKSDVQISPWRRWLALSLRIMVVLCTIFALAGIQWKRPQEGLNVFYLLDRSDSIPSPQQEAARNYVNQSFKQKTEHDKGGVLVFGTDASLESSANPAIDLQKIHAVVDTERTDIGSAIRLATAAFPETGQKRMVLLSDGNENIGDAITAILAAKPLGVTMDVVPLGAVRGNDIAIQKLSLPNNLKKGQTFDVKIFAQADQPQKATVRLYRNDQYLDSQVIELAAGKNLFSFPQTLDTPGFYSYDIQLEGANDQLAQNNRAVNFTYVRGNPSILVISSDPSSDAPLAEALRQSRIDVKVTDLSGFPSTLAEMQSYDTIFLSNIAAGDMGSDMMRLLESAVRDFGVGLVCLGGDQSFAAGGYRDTPLERALPVDMELSSKKVLPSGALVLVVHATEFPNGNQWARDIAFAALQALGPQDEMGIVLWNGTDNWLFPLQKVGDKKSLGRLIAGMNPGDMVSFQNVMAMAHTDLKKSNASLKHMVVFSDGDPTAPSTEQVESIVADKITVSTVMIGGHVSPTTMTWMAEVGRGRFYDVRSPAQLPQIFIKEAAVILKSAIFEKPFKPRLAQNSELLRGISAQEYPLLQGYVATTAKPRAEIPLVSEQGDPLLAHWQYGLGRSVAFTSDAKAKWAQNWLDWPKYRQFWSQVAQWSLRKVENADFTTDINVDRGEGQISVEAVDAQGNFRNFLNLETVIVSPKGERQTVRLEQTGPGHYEARFPTREVGAYLINLMETRNGQLVGSQVLGASVNYSPEFNNTEPNLNLLTRLAELGGGKVLDLKNPAVNPFTHDRLKTFQPRDLWEWMLQVAIILFVLDVGVRRIQIDAEEWRKATLNLRRALFFWKATQRPVEADEALGALLARKEKIKSALTTTPSVIQPNPDLFKPVAKPPADMPPGQSSPPQSQSQSPLAASSDSASPKQESTASRLLDAKRRAMKK